MSKTFGFLLIVYTPFLSFLALYIHQIKNYLTKFPVARNTGLISLKYRYFQYFRITFQCSSMTIMCRCLLYNSEEKLGVFLSLFPLVLVPTFIAVIGWCPKEGHQHGRRIPSPNFSENLLDNVVLKEATEQEIVIFAS